MVNLTIGIDATNLRRGGGVTNLLELLRVAQPELHGFDRIVVWGGHSLLKVLEDRPWLDKRNPPALDKSLIIRTFWQRYRLSRAARAAGCDLLLVPGGSYAGNFHPVVTMSQNLLPFEMHELQRYGWTFFALKLLLLRVTQSRTFRQTDGVIFLTEYARDAVFKVTGKLRGQTRIIPLGLNPRFYRAPKQQHAIADYDEVHPFRVLYVSIIDQYKHQWHVVEAVVALRQQGLPIKLDLIGPAFPTALKRLNAAIAREDAEHHWVHYHGAIPFVQLHNYYAQADLGLFASSCENMPNILLETMAAGLPIACSRKGPMPDVLGEAGLYFDPEKPAEIAAALRELIDSPELRMRMAQCAYERAKSFSWKRCADETFGFLAEIAQQKSGKTNKDV